MFFSVDNTKHTDGRCWNTVHCDSYAYASLYPYRLSVAGVYPIRLACLHICVGDAKQSIESQKSD
jgi:hypothetical protein